MNNRHITAVAATTLLLTLSACSTFSVDTSQKIFNAPSYLGKELPSGFIANQHSHHEDSGHDFRGYHFGKRHWNF